MLDIWQIWVILGLILLTLEIFTNGFFMASIGFAAIISGIFAFFSVGKTLQIFIFCFSAVLIFFSLKPLYKKLIVGSKTHKKLGIEALIGKTGKVIEKIEQNNSGRVLVNGENWKASSTNNEKIEVDTGIKVVKIQGITVFVEKL